VETGSSIALPCDKSPWKITGYGIITARERKLREDDWTEQWEQAQREEALWPVSGAEERKREVLLRLLAEEEAKLAGLTNAPQRKRG